MKQPGWDMLIVDGVELKMRFCFLGSSDLDTYPATPKVHMRAYQVVHVLVQSQRRATVLLSARSEEMRAAGTVAAAMSGVLSPSSTP